MSHCSGNAKYSLQSAKIKLGFSRFVDMYFVLPLMHFTAPCHLYDGNLTLLLASLTLEAISVFTNKFTVAKIPFYPVLLRHIKCNSK